MKPAVSSTRRGASSGIAIGGVSSNTSTGNHRRRWWFLRRMHEDEIHRAVAVEARLTVKSDRRVAVFEVDRAQSTQHSGLAALRGDRRQLRLRAARRRR